MNLDLFLQRIGYLSDLGCTLGILSATLPGKTYTYATIEQPPLFDPPYKAGHPNHSCIPDADYPLVRHSSPAHPLALAMVRPDHGIYHEPGDIPESEKDWARWGCLIHNANFARQLEGCIAVGRSHLLLMDTTIGHPALAVDQSEDCLKELMGLFEENDPGVIHIRPIVGFGFNGEALPFSPMPFVGKGG